MPYAVVPGDMPRATAVADLRSLLFAPAVNARHARGALSSEADAAIIDLEDAVAESAKAAARNNVPALLTAAGGNAAATSPAGPYRFVRINGVDTEHAYADLCAVVVPGLDGILVPKVEMPEQLVIVAWLLSQLERAQGLAEHQLAVLPIIESAAGLEHLEEIARATPRVQRLCFGALDLSLDIGADMARQPTLLAWARARLAVASRAAGLAPPIDTVYPDIDDLDGLRAECEAARDGGFGGKLCIHPKQVAVVNATFAPSAADVAHAHAVAAAYERALAGRAAAIRLGTQMVDYPVYARARRVLERAADAERRKR